MTYHRQTHPDELAGDDLVARTKGDALHLVALTREHGAGALHTVLDYYGPEHTKRVAIALAAAVDVDATQRKLWGWLDDRLHRLSRSLEATELWKMIAPADRDPRGDVQYSDEARQRMASRARANSQKITKRRRAS